MSNPDANTGSELSVSDSDVVLESPSALFEITATGIPWTETDTPVPQAEWEGTIKSLLRFGHAFPWIVGDLIAYGETHYGETYVQAIEATGRAYSTLAQ